jgi:hypothetical protein
VVLALAVALGCDAAAAPPEAPLPPAWPDAPEGFELVRLPPSADACEGPVVWIGLRDVTVTRDDASLVPGSGAREGGPAPSVADAVGAQVAAARSPLRMTGSYNGPGGEPLFRWHLGSSRVILMFDRRVPRARFREALRGADEEPGWPIRVGGIDARGQARCVIVATRAPMDMGPSYEGRIDRDGALVVSGSGPSEARLAVDTEPAPLPGEIDRGIGILRIRLDPGTTPAAALHALALGRWGERRYAYLAPP